MILLKIFLHFKDFLFFLINSLILWITIYMPKNLIEIQLNQYKSNIFFIS